MLKTIFAQETRAEAETRWEIVADALREKQPRRGILMDSSRDDVLAYMTFPREHWTQIASTNPVERVNREVKRRAGVIGVRAFLRTDGSHALTPERRGHRPPCRRTDAGDQRRMGGRAAIHVA
jgi:transposase-like protein